MSDDLDVSDDPALASQEKEVIIRFSRADDEATVHAEQSSVVRWLLNHPDYTERARRVKDGVQHATTGSLPIGAVKLSGFPRNHNRPAGMLGKLPGDEL